MPVRSIPMNYQNITGQISSIKAIGSAAFESSLERDLLIILDFNFIVDKFEVQPCRIKYLDEKQKHLSYTPDILVTYKSNYSKPRTVLYEVKYRTDLRNHWHEWKTKFKAAYAFALSQGWKFKIITEREIRQPYLDNARFLRRYNTPIEDSRLEIANKIMHHLRETDIETLVSALASSFTNKAEITHLIWQMISRGYLHTDLRQSLSMKARLWLP